MEFFFHILGRAGPENIFRDDKMSFDELWELRAALIQQNQIWLWKQSREILNEILSKIKESRMGIFVIPSCISQNSKKALFF